MQPHRIGSEPIYLQCHCHNHCCYRRVWTTPLESNCYGKKMLPLPQMLLHCVNGPWTRTHSIRMRTSRSLAVCQGVSFLGGASFWRVSFRGGASFRGGGGWYPSIHWGRPPVNRITDTSKNITLATTSLRPVNIWGFQVNEPAGNRCVHDHSNAPF